MSAFVGDVVLYVCEVCFEVVNDCSVGILRKGYNVVAVNFRAKASDVPGDEEQDHDDESEDGCPCQKREGTKRVPSFSLKLVPVGDG